MCVSFLNISIYLSFIFILVLVLVILILQHILFQYSDMATFLIYI